ncbi:hypothetical protein ACIBTV_25405 [Micromonospora sp. NPDC049366]|uniref:hypothetical protein n=1 Tax=Micromonospora sp. NPDC049366 TaxID=3364271 RepID=UPI00379E0E4B
MTHTANAPARLTPASLPPLQGQTWDNFDGRWRLYTVEHLSFDALPECGKGGPAKVAATNWTVSASSVSRALSSPGVVAADDGMHTLQVIRLCGPTGSDIEQHPLNGTKYASADEAWRAAYGAGLLGFMVYEGDAARFGLPTADDEQADPAASADDEDEYPPRTDDLYEMPEPGADLNALDGDE